MYIIITRNQCNFCDTAKALLRGANLPYTEYNVQSGSSKWILTLVKQAGHTTVPQIFSGDGTHIGGYTELKTFIDLKNNSTY
ncbi:glutaredoxin 3 [bacterium]|nr:glutaredoxin 3 [bacterium]